MSQLIHMIITSILYSITLKILMYNHPRMKEYINEKTREYFKYLDIFVDWI